MLTSLLRALPKFGRRWKPLNFSNPNFVRVPEWYKIDEENIPDYVAAQYYPTRIGEIIKEQYQVVGKLGFGSTSTAWLARDIVRRRYVMLKIFIQSSSLGQQVDDEVKMYRHIESFPNTHPGRGAIRTLLDTFDIEGPADRHRCLVHPPLFESVLTFLRRNPVEKLPSPVLAFVLYRLFLALDFLHTECQVTHTDIKADNIMLGIDDDSVFREFEEIELKQPVPRRELEEDGRIVYMSRDLRFPKKLGPPFLCDLGSAILGDHHSEFAQPNIYRAPEVILGATWSYPVDIWNVGCMIWDVFEGGSLFPAQDPEFERYRSRAHLAEIINLLGPPPATLLSKGQLTDKFFAEDGSFRNSDLLTGQVPLEKRESTLEGLEEREVFLRLMRKMLQWDPEKRSSAKELAQDEWIQMHL